MQLGGMWGTPVRSRCPSGCAGLARRTLTFITPTEQVHDRSPYTFRIVYRVNYGNAVLLRIDQHILAAWQVKLLSEQNITSL